MDCKSHIETPVCPALFAAIQMGDLDSMVNKDLTCVLPYLTRLLNDKSFLKIQDLISLLYPIKKINDVIKLMSITDLDFQNPASQLGLSDFEATCGHERLTLVLSSFMQFLSQVRQLDQNSKSKLQSSVFFDNQTYFDDICFCLSVLLFKAPMTSVINILDMCETLLYLKDGPIYICRLVANMPDKCLEVCLSLINYGESQDDTPTVNEVSDHRAKTVRFICQMNPSLALLARSEAMRVCKMPALVFMISLDYCLQSYENIKQPDFGPDTSSQSTTIIDTRDQLNEFSHEKIESSYDNTVAFITGILLGADEKTRMWLAQFIKSSQKKIDQGQDTILLKFRSHIQKFISDNLIPKFNQIDCQLDETEPLSNTELALMFNNESTAKEANKIVIRTTATLRMYCALRGIGSIKLNDLESSNLLRLITIKLPANQSCVYFATTGLCTLLACSAMIVNQRDEKIAADWLKWSIKSSNYSSKEYAIQGKCSISELMLLLAIHFQNNQNNRIAELVCSTLDMKLQIKASVSKCKSLYVQEVLNDQMVTEHASKVPVTKNLNNDIEEFLPVHCIHQLIESRSFSKHQVPIKDWIYEQICNSIRPVHHILPKLIEAYVNSIVISTHAYGPCGTNERFTQEELMSIFKVKLYLDTEKKMTSGTKRKRKISSLEASDEREIQVSCFITSQILFLYYLLLYEDLRLKKNPEMSIAERAKVVKYDIEFMMDVPIFYLLQVARENQDSFNYMLPGLMKLVTAQYPQLCLVQHWLIPESSSLWPADSGLLFHSTFGYLTSSTTLSSQSRKSKLKITEKQIANAFEHIEEDPISLKHILLSINSAHKTELWKYVSCFVSNLSLVLKFTHKTDEDSEELMRIVGKLWWKFNAIFPRKLWVDTVNALRNSGSSKSNYDNQPFEYDWNDLVSDPLIVLRCDRKVFRCLNLLNVNLYILNAFLAASKRRLYDHLMEQPGSKDRSREELCIALIAAQTSAAIQILLEHCLPTLEEEDALERHNDTLQVLTSEDTILVDKYERCIGLICDNLHQAFIADTNLAKLVHFQTYPERLLSITANKIPSLHICLDFIPEMLNQPDLTKQAFVIELTSYLCEKYPITKSLSVAKLCFNTTFTLLQVLSCSKRATFFIRVLPALLRICKTFPILLEDASIIINQIKQVTIAHLSLTTSRFGLNSSKSLDGLERISWEDAERLMSKLSPIEALHICIHKCMLELEKMKSEYTNSCQVLIS